MSPNNCELIVANEILSSAMRLLYYFPFRIRGLVSIMNRSSDLKSCLKNANLVVPPAMIAPRQLFRTVFPPKRLFDFFHGYFNPFSDIFFQVDLNNNLISELSANTLTAMSKLTRVNLAENKLSKFSLNSLALSGNPTGRSLSADGKSKGNGKFENENLPC